jgi:hypothetical protein
MERNNSYSIADKNLTNVVEDLTQEGVNAHDAQQQQQDKNDIRKKDLRNQRK